MTGGSRILTGKVMMLNTVDIVDVYIELEEVKKKKLTHSIDVSNLNSEQIIRILQKCVFQPVIVELKVFVVEDQLSQDKLISKDLKPTFQC